MTFKKNHHVVATGVVSTVVVDRLVGLVIGLVSGLKKLGSNALSTGPGRYRKAGEE